MMLWRGWAGVLLLICLAATGPVAHAVNGSGATALFYDKMECTLQLSWLMEPSSLRYTRNKAGLASAKVITEVRIYSDTTLYQEQEFSVQTGAVRVEDLSLQHLLVQRSYVLRRGRNRIRLRLYQEEAPGEAWVFETTVQVLATLPGKPFFSSLQLLDTSYASQAPSFFAYKGYHQFPRPFAFYGDGERNLNFYLEVYETEKADTSLFPLVCRVGLVKKNGNQMLRGALYYDTLRKPADAEPYSFRGSINLSTVASGNYNLTAQLLDRKGQELARQQQYFQLVNRQPDPLPADSSGPAAGAAPGPVDTADLSKPANFLNLAETFVGKYKDDEITAILRMLIPISSEGQKEAISSFLLHPEPLLSRYFIYNFFDEKSPKHPETAWKQYADKVREVNNLFAGRGGTAYASDRGIIYLRYGKPTERIQVYNENGAVPYEIWTYRQIVTTGSPGKFLFYQPSGMTNQFRLLHSTIPGEVYDSRWHDKIYPNGGGTSVNTSRANQEFGN